MFSIMNSLVIVLFLSGMVAMIMLRTLHKDIARYNQLETSVSNHIGEFEHVCRKGMSRQTTRNQLVEANA